MNGSDMERCIAEAQKARQPRETAEAMRRNQEAAHHSTAADCLAAGRDPERRFEPLRRQQG